MSDPFLPQLAKAIFSVPELLKEIYSDLAKPGVQQVGKALGGILGLGNTALYPVHLLNERTSIILKLNMDKYREQMENTKDDDTIEVAPEIGVPIAEKLSYVSNEELSNMYINLLAKASTKTTVNQAHPGFANLIDRLCPDEAIFLKNMKQFGDMPFVEVILKWKDKNQWTTIKDFACTFNYLNGLNNEQNIGSYITNLDALGILSIRRDIWIEPQETTYDPIKDVYRSMKIDENILKERFIDFKKCQVKITQLGIMFIKACFTKL